jgi:hypothetical protein
MIEILISKNSAAISRPFYPCFDTGCVLQLQQRTLVNDSGVTTTQAGSTPDHTKCSQMHETLCTIPLLNSKPLVWKSNVHNCIHKSASLDPAMSQLNPIHTHTTYFFEIHFNIIPCTGRPCQKVVFLSPRACYVSHPLILDSSP